MVDCSNKGGGHLMEPDGHVRVGPKKGCAARAEAELTNHHCWRQIVLQTRLRVEVNLCKFNNMNHLQCLFTL